MYIHVPSMNYQTVHSVVVHVSRFSSGQPFSTSTDTAYGTRKYVPCFDPRPGIGN